MGSWSVHCCISKIAITSSQDCCVLPLRKSSYNGWIPATLPVFGQYNDYGELEEVVKDANTKLIEEHFGVSIEEFLTLIIESKFYMNRTEDIDPTIEKMGSKYDEMKEWKFMWIDKKVFDLMSKPYYELGRFEFGNPAILTLLGFKRVDEIISDKIHNPKRYNQVWDRDGVKLYSDGEYVHAANNALIYSIDTLDYFMPIPEELQYLKTKTQLCLWRVMDEYWQVFNLLIAFDDKYYSEKLSMLSFLKRNTKDDSSLYERLMKDRSEQLEEAKLKYVHRLYFEDLNTFGDDIVKLRHIRTNMYFASTTWNPFEMFLTPQCGERKLHDILLSGFVEINKSYISDYNDDDGEGDE